MSAKGDNQTYWGIQLDEDLLETIISIYPEWFKDCNFRISNMAEGNTHHISEDGKIIIPLYNTRDVDSPPKAIVDEASLQKAMNKNKESLKVKLMLRRPINQLVEQGIMPSIKTSPHFHEQRQKLERAKMGDILKNKIQRRPDRQELIQQHILEDTTVDPSLQDKQRQLKKARLADDLNDRLSHRPGPLELIKGNILQTDEKFAQAVKEGHIPFKRTCEGQTHKHPPPRFLFEEDSGSEGASSPQEITDQSQNSIPSLEISGASTPMQDSPESADFKPYKENNESTNNNACVPHIPSHSNGISSSLNRTEISVSSNKSRKKSKSKSQPKTRTIKFHEYKGPPNAQKNQSSSSSSSSTAETSYELLLQQQQLFLQWQLEWQQKYPQIILPAAQKSDGDQGTNSGSIQINIQSSDQCINQESSTSQSRNISKLEDMKVSDLKAELKRRNLPVSGSKPQLIERLKPYSDTSNSALTPLSDTLSTVTTMPSTSSLPLTIGSIFLDTTTTTNTSAVTTPTTTVTTTIMANTSISNTAPTSISLNQNDSEIFSPVTINTTLPNKINSNAVCEDVKLGIYKIPSITQVVSSRPPSVAPMEIDTSPSMMMEAMDVNDNASTPMTNDEIVKIQQKKIEELQRELQRSQMQLQQHQNIYQQPQQIILSAPVNLHCQSNIDTNSTKTINQGSLMDNKFYQRQILQQHFQQKIQQQQILQQNYQQKAHHHSQQQTEHHSQQQPCLGSSGIANIIPTSQPSSAAVKANLAAFLHNQHSLSSLTNVSISSPVISQIAASQPVVSIPARVLTAQSVNSNLDQTEHDSKQTITGPLSCLVKNSQSPKIIDSYPNGINHKRNSSLSNFNNALSSKQTDKRVTNESSFITKPPPDYNEATKQLVKSQQISNRSSDERVIKSQAVDDVLEILIKNGELPPSAAQEPPLTSNIKSVKTSASSAICPNFSVKTDFPITSCQSTTLPQIQSVPPTLVNGHTSMTSPPSAVLEDQDNNGNTPLDFDFHLDLDDIEAMDLGGVLVGNGSSNSVPKLDSNHSQSENNNQQNILEENSSSVILSNNTGNMDVELSDWLDVMIPSTSAITTTSNACISNNNLQQNNVNNSYRNDPDPLLSTLANSNDLYDLFSIEDLDFKTPVTDLNLHTWDKVDFAT